LSPAFFVAANRAKSENFPLPAPSCGRDGPCLPAEISMKVGARLSVLSFGGCTNLQIPNYKLPHLRRDGAGSGEISPIYIGGEPGQMQTHEYARLGLRGVLGRQLLCGAQVLGMALNSEQHRRALSSRRNFPLPAPSCISGCWGDGCLATCKNRFVPSVHL